MPDELEVIRLLKPVRGCATDEQFQEIVANVLMALADTRRRAMFESAEIARASGRRQFLAADPTARQAPCIVSYGVIADDIECAAAIGQRPTLASA